MPIKNNGPPTIDDSKNSTSSKNSISSINSNSSINTTPENLIESSIDDTPVSPDHSTDHSPQAGIKDDNKKLLLDRDSIIE